MVHGPGLHDASSMIETSTLHQRFAERTPASRALAHRAARVLPGGDTRSGAHHAPYSLTFTHGQGPWLHDVDGHRYIDAVSNFTSLVHGNAYPPVVHAVQSAAARGTAWPARVEAHVELAEAIAGRVASVDLVRFCNSGTEANLLALRLARAVTGRDCLLAARGGYHGSVDEFMTATKGVPGPMTLLAEYGDLDSFRRVLAEQGDRVAAVFVEPVMGAGGVVSAPPGFVHGLAEVCRQAGALLVLDEVIAFRLAEGGAQSLHGVRPDLTTFGKVIGGGLPVGALGGRADLLERYDPRRSGSLDHGGTFNGNPVTAAAGVATLRDLTAAQIARMEQLGERLSSGLRAAGADAGLPVQVRRAGSLLNVYLQEDLPPTSAERRDTELISAWHVASLLRGVFFASRGMLVISTVMDDALVDEIIDRAGSAFKDVAALVGVTV